MREIKFRAWSTIDRPTMIYIDNQKGSMIDIQGDQNEWIVMQYTGLKDKNGKGKEVYGSDLIRALPLPCGHKPKGIYEIVWDKERLEWGIKSKDEIITSLWTFTKDFEIIGNKYENPKLIKL